jgi:hypothetical protein
MRSLLLRVSEVLGGEKTISIFFSYPQRHVLNTTRKKIEKKIEIDFSPPRVAANHNNYNHHSHEPIIPMLY